MQAAARRRHPLYDTSLFQFRQPAFWLYIVIVAATGLSTLHQQGLFRQISPAGWALSWGLLLLYALPVFLVVVFLDLYEREPMSLLVAALLWGAVAATTLAGLANDGWGLMVARLGGPEFAARWTASLTAPFVEEILKGIGVVLIYLIARSEVDDVMDGFVYGALVGLGFAVVEDVFYFMAVFGGRPNGVVQGFFLRVVSSGLYSHVLYTGLVGMGVGYVVSRRDATPMRTRLWVAAGLTGIAVVGHFLWNSPLFDLFPDYPWTGTDFIVVPLATAVKGLPLLVFVVIAITLARRRERRWLHEALVTEVGSVGISPQELADLEDPKRRRRARAEMRARAGDRAAALLRRLQREQVNLAMARSKFAAPDDPAVVQQREYIRSLRDALMAMPGAAPAESGGLTSRHVPPTGGG
jgi:RsiW-degrading membrane proteinase PrsW (M82 family)